MWIAVAVTLFSGFVSGMNARHGAFDESYVGLQFFVFAVLISWFIGREQEEGIFRNKIVVGYTKKEIFISEIILAVVNCSALFLMHAVMMALCNMYVFTLFPTDVLIKVFIGFWLLNIVMVVALVTFSCLMRRRAIVGIVNILFVIIVWWAGYQLESGSDTVDYQDVMEKNWEIQEKKGGEDAFGVTADFEIALGKICKVVQPAVPFGQVVDYSQLIQSNFGYYNETYNFDTGQWEGTQVFPEKFEMTREMDGKLEIYIIYSLVEIIVITVGGCIIFGHMNLK